VFDSTQNIITEQAPADRQDLSLADSIIAVVNQESSLQESFVILFQTVEREIRRLIQSWHLTRVVEEEQIRNTVTDFIEDLSASPDQSRFIARLLAMIIQKAPEMRQHVQYYASRRLFTLMKQNASASSKSYLAFNEMVKKQLNTLADEGLIRHLSNGCWTAGTKTPAVDADFFSPSVLDRIQLKSSTNRSGIKGASLKQAILDLLSDPEHIFYSFKPAALSTMLFNLTTAPSFLVSFGYENEPVDNQPQPHKQYEISAAAGSILEQVSLQLDESQRLPVLMAGLAYCFIACPSYFAADDFISGHHRILTSDNGMIDRIHEFLNTEQFRNLFTKEPGRSTVFNRIRSFKAILEASLTDFPVEAQQAGIKSLVNFMICQYSRLVGRQP